jgi:hypothetical protein
MKPTKLTVTLGRTVNLRNFESKRLDFQIELVLEEGDTIQATKDAAMKACKAFMNQEGVET